ncbi:hypothetical protein VZT92_023791 [Zoarces viviparus]|uniref:Uncharacterized protein n=1 Tax=Zoarces viviparus TaxID=48416 RepID=A0AAW1E859_ZOAVI
MQIKPGIAFALAKTRPLNWAAKETCMASCCWFSLNVSRRRRVSAELEAKRSSKEEQQRGAAKRSSKEEQRPRVPAQPCYTLCC